jgi:hypothetical protein
MKKHQGHSTTSLPVTPSLATKPGYIDASTSRGNTGSPPVRHANMMAQRRSNTSPKRRSAPNTPYVPSPLSKPVYVDKSIQCDRDEFDPTCDKPKVFKVPQHLLPMSPPDSTPPLTFIPFAKRLLRQAYSARQELEAMSQPIPSPTQSHPSLASPVMAAASSSEQVVARAASGVVNQDTMDVDMKDAAPATSTTTTNTQKKDVVATQSTQPSLTTSEPTIKPPPPPWPSTAAHISPLRQPINGYRATELRVQLPATPALSNASPTTPSVSLTPSSATASVSQSPWSLPSASTQPSFQTPGASVVAPSPIKKKLSLGDYMNRARSNLAPNNDKTASSTAQPQQSNSSLTATTAASTATLPKLDQSLKAEAKEQDLEGSAIEDTPMMEAGDHTTEVTATTCVSETDTKV